MAGAEPLIREFRLEDVPEVAALLRRVRGDNLYSDRGVRHDVTSEPGRARAARWVAEQDGIVGYAVAMQLWWRLGAEAYAWAGVLPEARRLGTGTALWRRVEEHVASLEADSVISDVVADAPGETFLQGRGFTPVRLDRISVLDPRTVDLGELAKRRERAAADGYTVVGLDTVDPHAVYELSLEVGDDMPGSSAPHTVSFEEWQTSLLGFPELHPGASAVVVTGGRPVSLALLSVDLDTRRARNEETGTARAHRRRGLATLAKLATIGWAREHGIESILTDNAEQNAGILTINERLGYRPFLARRRYMKRLRAVDGSGPTPRKDETCRS